MTYRRSIVISRSKIQSLKAIHNEKEVYIEALILYAVKFPQTASGSLLVESRFTYGFSHLSGHIRAAFYVS